MDRVYIIYLSLSEEGDVLFSTPFSSFNLAKENVITFLENHASELGKDISFLSKEEFAKLKLEKTPEDRFYVRKKNSSGTIYKRVTAIGRIFNSYSIEKYGKLGIAEFDFSEKEKTETVQNTSVENLSHGVHVTFISELKDILSKRKEPSPIHVEKPEKKESPFIMSLIERKQTLRHITPPPPRKIISEISF